MIRLSVRYLIATAAIPVGLGTTPRDVVVASAAVAASDPLTPVANAGEGDAIASPSPVFPRLQNYVVA
ncbi:MAG: hypothetical protein JWN53_1241 [Gemmatimonadetes bacterium]|nr:hypothetical protein [Gemmatimonadota bacterium]